MKPGIYLSTRYFRKIRKVCTYILLIGQNKYGRYDYTDLTTKYSGSFQPHSIMADSLNLIHECNSDKAIDLYPEYFI